MLVFEWKIVVFTISDFQIKIHFRRSQYETPIYFILYGHIFISSFIQKLGRR
jgi:hypothetical protein